MRVPVCLFLFCSAIGCDGSLPTREQPAGDCANESDCSASGFACKEHKCAPCAEQTDCLSQVCDAYGDQGEAGKCVAADRVIYVDSSDTNMAVCFAQKDEPTGSQALPFCDLDLALAKLAATPGKIIRVFGSPDSYMIPSLNTTAGPVVLIGSGLFTPGKTASLSVGGDNGQILVAMGANVVLDGFAINLDGITAGPSTKIAIRRSVLSYMSQGASFGDGSVVTLDRDRISMGSLGIRFNTSTVNITNSFFTANTASSAMGLLNFNGGAGSFQFNTVAFNTPEDSNAGPLLNCASGSKVLIKNSIFAQNGFTKQLAPGCLIEPSSLVVGKADSTANQIAQEPAFVDPMTFDLRLLPQDPTNTQFVIDKAVGVNPATDKNVAHDYYGTPRPSGAGYDIGAFEVVSP